MEPVEVIVVNKDEVSCDGGSGVTGHPLVYLNIGKKQHIDCPYCGKRFVYKVEAA